MAITKSPLLYGAHGKIDGVYVRRYFDTETISAMPRKRCGSSRLQIVQNSFFQIATKCIKFVPAYAQTAFIRVGHKSPYNMCVSYLVNALKSVGVYDLVPSFKTMCEALVGAGSDISNGDPIGASVTLTEGAGGVVSLQVDASQELQAVVWSSDDGRFADYHLYEVPNTGLTQSLGEIECALVVLLDDGKPCQSSASSNIFIKP